VHSLDTEDNGESLTPTHSKRRQEQLKRRSLSPNPVARGGSLAGKVRDGTDSGTDNDSDAAPEYSLDDFDPASPAPALKKQASLQQQEPSAPIIAAPVAVAVPNPVNDIMARWLNPNPAPLVSSKMFAVLEDEDEDKPSPSPSPPAAQAGPDDAAQARPQSSTLQDDLASASTSTREGSGSDTEDRGIEDEDDGYGYSTQREEKWEDEEEGYTPAPLPPAAPARPSGIGPQDVVATQAKSVTNSALPISARPQQQQVF
jgi:hypothetical protein